MHTFNVERQLNVPIEKLWALVSDFSNLSWYSPAEKVEKVGNGIGEIRRITMPGMPAAIEERLLELEPQQHRLVYEVLENDINIMQDYTVTASLHSAGNTSTVALWQGQQRKHRALIALFLVTADCKQRLPAQAFKLSARGFKAFCAPRLQHGDQCFIAIFFSTKQG